MADEVVVGAVVAEPETKVNAEEPVVAEPVKGGDPDPQASENDGELDEHGKKRKGGWQRKIERLETEREFLMQELLKRRSSEPEPEPKPVEPSIQTTEPTPQDFDLGDGTYDIVKFNKAHFAWLKAEDVRQTEAKQKAESSKSEDKRIFDSWIASRDKAAEKYPDMEEVLQVPVIPDSKSQPEKYKFVSREIMSSPYAGELAYYLGKHPEEAFALWEKSNLEIVRGLGRIEAQFARAESAEPEQEKPVVPPPTQAPKPATPIKKTSAANAPVDPRTAESDKLSPDEWLKARRAQLKGK